MLSHLWTDCLEILHGYFFWPYTTSKFSTALHDENLIFRGQLKHPIDALNLSMPQTTTNRKYKPQIGHVGCLDTPIFLNVNNFEIIFLIALTFQLLDYLFKDV